MKKNIRTIAILACLLAISYKGIAQTTGQKIGENPTKKEASAVLELEAKDKGFLLPRVSLTRTTVSAPVTNPAQSLIVFNTDFGVDVTPGYYYWSTDEAKWIRLLDNPTQLAIEPWLKQSNDQKATQNTDNIYQEGNVSIGTFFGNKATPIGATLEVFGSLRVGGQHMLPSLPEITMGTMAVGFSHNVGGAGNVAFGSNITMAGGGSSIAAGQQNTMTNSFKSFILGEQNTMKDAYNAFVFGRVNTVSGFNTVVFGDDNIGGVKDATIFGRYNAVTTVRPGQVDRSDNTYYPQDPLFQIGNGNAETGSVIRNNALTMLNNGNTGIGIIGTEDNAKPTEMLDIGSGKVRIRDLYNNTTDPVDAATDKVVVAGIDGVLKTAAIKEGDLRLVGTVGVNKQNNHITVDAGFGGTGTSAGTGTDNVLIGFLAGNSIVSANRSIAIGTNALETNTTDWDNVAIGANALRNSNASGGVDGGSSVAVGMSALENNTTGRNVAVGTLAAQSNTNGTNNLAMGYASLQNNSSGNQNIALGRDALINSTGNDNIGIGYKSGAGLTAGSNNLSIGSNVNLPSNTASNQLNIGNWIYGNNGLIGLGNEAKTPTERLDIGSGKVKIRELYTTNATATDDKMVVTGTDGVLKTTILKNGIDGKSMLSGTSSPPSNGTGKDGDTYVNTITGATFTKTGGVWTADGGSLKGPAGAAGTPGAAGGIGPQGPTGTFTATVNNGLQFTTPATPTNIELGGPLVKVTTIATTGLALNITGLPTTGAPADAIVVSSGGGQLKTISTAALVSEPWNVIQTTTGVQATTNKQDIYQEGSVAIGKAAVTVMPDITPGLKPKLYVAGDILADGKVWTTNSVYADYVFEKYFAGKSNINPNYEFKSLNYVRDFVKANNHLPGVMSISDLRKGNNGYSFDMTKLTIQSLEKIEELYLHTLEQKDQIDTQQKEIVDMKARLERLEKLLLKN